MKESDRISIEEIGEHPFIADAFKHMSLNELDIDHFTTEMSRANKHYYSDFPNADSPAATASRLNETIILTTKGDEQVRTLMHQLVNADNFCDVQFDMSSSNYFKKHYDISIYY